MSIMGSLMARPAARRVRSLIAVLVLGLTACDDGGPIKFGLPIDCVPGEDCWVVGHVDVDPGPGAMDYTCGNHSYDGSFGTQIAIRDRHAMRVGVPVFPAAPGEVVSVRDGMPDIEYGRRSYSKVEGRTCGNLVKIDHGGGWTSLYCHLRRGSVGVKKGQSVDSHTVIGMVGLSGRTPFPQLLFAVKKDGKTVDPFTGGFEPSTCDIPADPLWKSAALDAMPYERTMLFNVGIADHQPSVRSLRRDGHRRSKELRRRGMVVLWVDMFFVEKHDLLHLSVIGPRGGTIMAETIEVDATSARRLYYYGKRSRGGRFEAGTYKGTVTLWRRTDDGQERIVAKTEAIMR